jgi:hypothetical protein
MHHRKTSETRVRRITDWERLRSAKAHTILGSVRQMSNLRSFTRVREPQQARPEIRVVTYNVLANKYAMGGYVLLWAVQLIHWHPVLETCVLLHG